MPGRSQVKSQVRPTNEKLFWVLLGALLWAIGCAAVMSVKHIWAITLPGCGEGGGCDWAINGPYSKVFGLPTAFLGLGYFLGSLCYLALSRKSFPQSTVVWIVRAGGLASLALVAIMLIEGKFCPWCAMTHAANLIYWVISERLRADRRKSGKIVTRDAALASALFATTIIALIIVRAQVTSNQEQVNYKKGMESVAKIGADTLASDAPATETIPTVTSEPPKKKASEPASSSPKKFGGRYWEGNPNAPVRIVVFHDYECKLCREAEAAIAQLMSSRRDVALSIKQWPFDAACNRFILGANMHPGACEAAKVAEAAGIVGGEKAFWGMHHWLMARGGEFKQAELRSQLSNLGLDVEAFGTAYAGPITDSLVRADIEEGMAFGLAWTPLIFVNGYKVEGWQSAGVLPAAIERAAEVAKRNPRRNDRPDLALDIQYHAWLATPAVPIGLRDHELSWGIQDAPTTILIYGDLTCVFHASGRALLDDAITVNPNVRVVFRDFPLDANCNPLVKQQINPRACEASRWALAVGKLKGANGYWKAHNWIVHSRDDMSKVTLENLSQAVDVAKAAIEQTASSAEVENELKANIALAVQMGVTMSPTIYVNGKNVAGWRTPGLLARVISSASGGK